MTNIVKIENGPTVRLTGDRAVFEGFEEADPSVVELLAGAENSEVAAHTYLQIGRGQLWQPTPRSTP